MYIHIYYICMPIYVCVCVRVSTFVFFLYNVAIDVFLYMLWGVPFACQLRSVNSQRTQLTPGAPIPPGDLYWTYKVGGYSPGV